MRGTFKSWLLLVLVLLALLSGCKKRKPAVPPPAAQAPTVNVPPPPAEPQPHPLPAGQTVSSLPPVQPPPPKPKRSVARKHEPKPEAPKPEAPKPEPEKAAVKSTGPESNTQLAAGLPAGEVQQQRQNTAQLRSTTENSLRALTRTLSKDEEAMVQQIHAYLQQSRTAETDGDTEGAYNLAFKAHLLCAELNKH